MNENQIALHEAAHAIASEILFGKCNYATVIADDGRDGHTRFIPPAITTHRVACYLVGPVCDQRTAQRIGALSTRDNDVSDAGAYVQSLYRAPIDFRETAEWQEGEQLARQTVARYWPCIERLSRWLLTRKTARGELVRRLVSDFNQLEKTNHVQRSIDG